MPHQSVALPSDELAYLSAQELALRIRRRELSPVEVVDTFIQRIETRNPSLNAFVYFGFDSARARATKAEQALMAGEQLGTAARRSLGAQGSVRFQAGMACKPGRHSCAQAQRRQFLLCLLRAHGDAGRRNTPGQNQQPCHGIPRHV